MNVSQRIIMLRKLNKELDKIRIFSVKVKSSSATKTKTELDSTFCNLVHRRKLKHGYNLVNQIKKRLTYIL